MTMMHIDISLGAAVSAAPSPDAASASADTPAGASDLFAALLDEAADTSGEPLPVDAVDQDEPAFDALAALAMPSLLCIGNFLPPVSDPVEGDSSVVGEVRDQEDAIDQATYSALTVTGLPVQAAASIGVDISAVTNNTPDAVDAVATGTPVPSAPVDVVGVPRAETPAKDVTGATTDAPRARDAAAPSRVASGTSELLASRVDETASEPQTPASKAEVDADVVRASKADGDADAVPTSKADAGAARVSTPSSTLTTSRVERTTRAPRADVAVAADSSEGQPQTPGIQPSNDAGKSDRLQQAVPAHGSGTAAARLARALERAAALVTSEASADGAPAAQAALAGQNGQQQAFDEPMPDRTAQPFGAVRHPSTGGVTFTVAAPAPVDARTLATAVSAIRADAAPVSIPERDLVAQLVQSMRMQFRDGIGEAVVKLKPEHLGSVQISLRIENGAVKATVQAEMPAVRQWLESQQDTLKNSLADQGLRLERFGVEPDGERQATAQDAERERQRQQRRQHRQTPQADQPVFEVTV